EAIGMIVFFIEMNLFYVHANLNWDHGPFKFVIASPRFHRWHHADKPEAYGKNLANMIPAYDWMFGTYYNPEPCRERMGAPGVPDTDTVALMFSPFTLWREQWEKSFGKKPMTAPDDTASPAPSAQS
ncbi:MAG: sterol desaturase family protein, partial [Pseudomonadota bacterium]